MGSPSPFLARYWESYLLQLHILQIASHHHFQYNEKLPVADVAVTIDVIHFEGEPQFLFLVAFGAKGAETGDELLEVDVATSVFIKNSDHAVTEWELISLGKFRDGVRSSTGSPEDSKRLEEVRGIRPVLSFPNYPACILSMASGKLGSLEKDTLYPAS